MTDFKKAFYGLNKTKANELNTVISELDTFHDTIDDYVTDTELTSYVTSTALNTQLESYVTSTGLTTILADYVVNKSGTGATITASGTSIEVTHGCSATPTKVIVSPTTLTGGKQFYVSAKTSTTFTITLDSSHTSDIVFDWIAIV